MHDEPRFRSFGRLAIWLAFSALVGLGTARYLDTTYASELEAAYVRAETVVGAAERALLRADEEVRTGLRLIQLRRVMQAEGVVGGADVIDTYIEDMIRSGRHGLRNLVMVGLDGRIEWSVRPGFQGVSIADRDVFRDQLRPGASGIAVGAPVIARVSNAYRVMMTQIVRDPEGEPLGVAAAALDPMALSTELSRLVPQRGKVVLIRRLTDGAVRAHSSDYLRAIRGELPPNERVMAMARQSPAGRYDLRARSDGRHIIGAWRVPEDAAVAVLATYDWDSALAEYVRLEAVVLASAALLVACGFLLLWAFERDARLRFRLAREAMLDPLTGLDNRRSLTRRMDKVMGAAASGSAAGAVLLFDIDHFKAVNDRWGHAMGDAVLRQVARLLRQRMRAGDIACRWGGEEIAMVLRGCMPEVAARRAEEMRGAIQDSLVEGSVRITVSVGIACFPADATDFDALMQAADDALYAAKRAGRNRIFAVGQGPAAMPWGIAAE